MFEAQDTEFPSGIAQEIEIPGVDGEAKWEYTEGDDDGLNDDLYGDLEANIFERTAHPHLVTREALEKRITELEETLTTFVKERIELRTKVRSLEKENALLHFNASSLYETAKFEVDRKNTMLTQLQTRLQEFAKRAAPSHCLSNDDIEETLQKCREIACEAGKAISIEEMKKSFEEFKRKPNQKSRARPVWSKKIRFNNMSVYYHSEQIPFNRFEEVKFVKPNLSVLPPSSDVVNSPDIKIKEENPCSGSQEALQTGELKLDSPNSRKSSKERNETSTAVSTPSDDNNNPSRRRTEERSRYHTSNSTVRRRDPTSHRIESGHYTLSENHVYNDYDRDRDRDRDKLRYTYSKNSRRDNRSHSRSPGKRRLSPDRSHRRRSNSRTRNRGSDLHRPSNSYKTSSHRHR